VPAALRPTASAGISLSTLAAQVGAIPAAGSTASDPRITGVTLRAQEVRSGDLFAALPGASANQRGILSRDRALAEYAVGHFQQLIER